MSSNDGRASHADVLTVATAMYANEPCRVCGGPVTMDDLAAGGVVFAGYSKDNTSRTAHGPCWATRKDDRANWAHPEDARPSDG